MNVETTSCAYWDHALDLFVTGTPHWRRLTRQSVLNKLIVTIKDIYRWINNYLMKIREDELTFIENCAFIIDKHYLETCIGDLGNLY